MAVDLSKETDKKRNSQAHTDGLYLKSRRQLLMLTEMIGEMEAALGFLSNRKQDQRTKKAIRTIQEQYAQTQVMIQLCNQATTWLGNHISEEEANGL